MRNHEEKSRLSYNAKADNYDNSADGKFTEKFKNLLLENVKVEKGYKLLDVACGNGTLLKRFADIAAIEGYGIDISENMVKNAKVRNPYMVFAVGECGNIPFADSIFDVVTVCAAFHHFPNPEIFAKEVYRLIKPGGMLYIAEIYYTGIFFTLLNLMLPLSPSGDVRAYYPQEIVEIFSDAGFREQKIETRGSVQLIQLQRDDDTAV